MKRASVNTSRNAIKRTKETVGFKMLETCKNMYEMIACIKHVHNERVLVSGDCTF